MDRRDCGPKGEPLASKGGAELARKMDVLVSALGHSRSEAGHDDGSTVLFEPDALRAGKRRVEGEREG